MVSAAILRASRITGFALALALLALIPAPTLHAAVDPLNLPIVGLSSPGSNQVFQTGGTIGLTAWVVDLPTGTSVSRVEFRRGTTLIGQDTSAPYTFAWSGAAAGSYTISAVAVLNSGTEVPSGSAAIQVKDAAQFAVTPQPLAKPVRPILEFVQDNCDGTRTAFFGYLNENSTRVVMPPTTASPGTNKFTPSPINRSQAAEFHAGRTPYWPYPGFAVIYSGTGNQVWTLNGRTSTAGSPNPKPVRTVAFQQSQTTVVESVGTVPVTVRLSSGATGPVTVSYTVTGTATSSTDFTPLSGTLVIPTGCHSGTATIPVNVINDALQEPTETIILTITAATGVELIGRRSVHTITITDNDATATPTVAFGGAASSAFEAAGTVNLPVVLSAASATPVVVPYSVSGTAGPGSDHALSAGSLTIPAGITAAVLAVPLTNDQLNEPDETVVVTLATPNGAILGTPNIHTLTIIDDDPLPVVTFAAATSSVAENTTTALIQVTLNRTYGAPVSIPVQVTGGTASLGSDFTTPSTPLIIPAGSTNGTISLPLVNDEFFESSETVLLALGTPGNGVLGTPASHTLTITDEDPAPIARFAVGSLTVVEAIGTTTVAVTLDRAWNQSVVVEYTVTGTATSDGPHPDFVALTGSATIAAGTLSALIPISISDDRLLEPSETIRLHLSTMPTPITLGLPGECTVTVIDDDPSLSPKVDGIEDNGDGTFTAYFGFTNPTPGTITRAIAEDNRFTATGSSTAARGQVVAFAPGSTPGWPDGAFSTRFSEDLLTWTLTDQSVSVTRAAWGIPLRQDPANRLPWVAITRAGTDFVAGRDQPITVAISATDPDGVLTRIDLLVGGASLTSVPIAGEAGEIHVDIPAQFATGPVELAAMAFDDRDGSATSASRTLLIRSPIRLDLLLDSPLVAAVGTTASLRAVLQDPDLGALARVEFRRDAEAPVIVTPPIAGAQTPWTVVRNAGGSRITATAVMVDGRTATSDAVRLIGNQPPQVAISSPTAGQSVLSVDGVVPLLATASDPDQRVRSVIFRIDGQPVATITTLPWRFDWTPDRTNATVDAIATDGFGLSATSAPVAFTLKPKPTAKWLIAPPTLAQEGVSVNLSAGADLFGGDSLGSLQIVRDGAVVAQGVSQPLTHAFLAGPPGTTTLAARVYTTTGVSAITPPTAMRINARPQVTVSLEPQQTFAYTGVPYQIRVDATDAETEANGGSLTASLTIDGTVVVGPTTTLPIITSWTAAGVGQHVIAATVTDHDGGVGVDNEIVQVKDEPTIVWLSPRAGQVFNRSNIPDLTLYAYGRELAVGSVSLADAVGGVTRVLAVFTQPTLPPAQYSTPWHWEGNPPAPGDHALTATVWDSASQQSFVVSTTVTISEPITVNITAPTAGAWDGNQPLAVDVAASISGAAIAYVDVQVDGVTVARDLEAPYRLTMGTLLSSGSHTIAAVAVDSRGSSARSAPIVLDVYRSPTIAWVTPAADQRLPEDTPVMLEVQATDDVGTPTVQFLIDGVAQPIITAAPYRLPWQPTRGLHRIEAVARDADGYSASVPVRNLLVATPPTVTLTPSPSNTGETGTPMTVIATATSSGGAIRSVTFQVDGETRPADQFVPFSATIDTPAAGSHTFAATAIDDLGVPSQLVGVVLTANSYPVATITSPASNTVLEGAQSVPVVIALSDPDTAATGDRVVQVDLYDGSLSVASLANPSGLPTTVTFTQSLALGAHALVAVPHDTRGAARSSIPVYVLVNPPGLTAPAITLTTPVDGAAGSISQAISLQASLASSANVLGVTFYAGQTTLPGSLDGTVATASWTPTLPGIYEVVAVAETTAGARSVSSKARVTIALDPGHPPAISLTSLAPNQTIARGQVVAVACNASDADADLAQIDLAVDNVLVGSLTVAAGSSTAVEVIPWSANTLGRKVITAIATDRLGNRTSSTAIPVNVVDGPTITLLAQAAGTTTPATSIGSELGASVTLLPTITSDAAITAVDFRLGQTLIGSATTPPYHLVWQPPQTADHLVTATVRDGRGLSATSAPVAIRANAYPVATITNLVDPVTVTASGSSAEVVVQLSATDPDDGRPAGGTVSGVALVVGSGDPSFTSGTSLTKTLHLQPGGYWLIPYAQDDWGWFRNGAPVRVLVQPEIGAAPSITSFIPAGDITIAAGTTQPLSVTATIANGNPFRVDFYAGQSQLTNTTATTATFGTTAPGRYQVAAVVTDLSSGASAVSSAPWITVLPPTNPAPVITWREPLAGTTLPTGQPIALMADASDADGVAQVAFYVNGVLARVISAGGPTYTADWIFSTAGATTLHAVAYDHRGATATTDPVTVTVSANAAPTITLSHQATGNVLETGSDDLITATATDDGRVVSVVMQFDGVDQLPELTTAPFTTRWRAPAAGLHQVTARATDNDGRSTSSAPLPLLVNSYPVAAIDAPADRTALTLDPGSTTVAVTVQVSASDVDAPGSVSRVELFLDGDLDHAVGTATGATGTFTVTLTEGAHVLTPKAFDVWSWWKTGNSVRILVNPPAAVQPTVALLSPTDGLDLRPGTSVTLTALASPAALHTIASVSFLVGNQTLPASQVPGTMTWQATWTAPALVPPFTSSTWQVAATATDDAGALGISPIATVRIAEAPNQPPTITFIEPLNGDALTAGQPSLIQMAAGDADGQVKTVEVYLDDRLLGSLTAAPYTMPWTPSAAGSHTLVAIARDDHGATTSEAISLQVQVIPSVLTVVITTPRSGGVPTGALSINADVFNGYLVSRVEFYAGTTLIGTATQAPWQVTWQSPPLGTQVLTAVATDYQGTAISQPVTVMVQTDNGAKPIALITSPDRDGATVGLEDIRGRIIAANPAASISAWRLDLFDANDQWLRLVASGTSEVGSATSDGVLGRLDTSLLENAQYQLWLTASDSRNQVATNANNEQPADRRIITVNGAAKVGNFAFTVQDLVIPAGDIAIQINRTYNTLNRSKTADLGYGWSLDLVDLRLNVGERRIMVEDADLDFFSYHVGSAPSGYPAHPPVTLTMPDGRRVTFEPELAEGGLPYDLLSLINTDPRIPKYSNPSNGLFGVSNLIYGAIYRSPTDVDAVLIPMGNPYVVTYPGFGTYWAGAGKGIGLNNYDVPGWYLRLGDGTLYVFNREDLGEHAFLFDEEGDGFTANEDMLVQAYGRPSLTRIIRPSGERIEIAKSGIAAYDTAGTLLRRVYLDRDGSGRVQGIYDPESVDPSTGRPYGWNTASVSAASVVYRYSTAGDLIEVQRLRDRVAKTYDSVKYTYYTSPATRAHYLKDIIDPTGTPVLKSEYDTQGRLIATVDATGKRTMMQHNIAAQEEIVFDRNGNQTIFSYDNLGNVRSRTNALGETTTTTYVPGTNYVQSETDALTRTTTYTRDAAGRPLTITDPLGQVTSFAYDSLGNTTQVQRRRLREDGSLGLPVTEVRQSFDGAGRLVRRENALGQVTSFGYDSAGRLSSQTQTVTRLREDGTLETRTVTDRFGHDAVGNIGSVTTAGGLVIVNRYDANGAITSQTKTRRLPDGTTQAVTTRLELDAQGRVMLVEEPDGRRATTVYAANGQVESTTAWSAAKGDGSRESRTTSHTYNARGERIGTQHPDGTTESWTRDAAGRILSATDRGGRTTRYRHDAVGRRTGITMPDGSSIAQGFDATGRPVSITDEQGLTTTIGLDAGGRRTSVTAAGIGGLIQVAHYTYADGNLASVTDPAGKSLRFAYDLLGRQTHTAFSDGTFTASTFDEQDRVIEQRDQDGTITRYGYDDAGRLAFVRDPGAGVTRYTYDELGFLVTEQDARNNVTAYEHDALGRRTLRRLPGGQVERMTYTPWGALEHHTDFANTTTTFTYEPVTNRLMRRAADNGEPAVTFQHYPDGRRLSMTDAVGTTTYQYDVRGRLVRKQSPIGTLSYEYTGSQLTRTFTDQAGAGGGADQRYQYDGLGRLASVDAAGFGLTGYEHTGSGMVHAVTLPNGLRTVRGYDDLNRPISTTTSRPLGGGIDGLGTLARCTYTLTPTGHPATSTEAVDGRGTRAVSWRYDTRARLISETISTTIGGVLISGTTDWTLDAVGNRLAQRSTISGIDDQTNTFNVNDRIDGEAYDANGNTVSATVAGIGTVTDAYTSQQRLRERIRSDGSIVRLIYSGDGHKVGETVIPSGGGAGITTWFLVDAVNPSGYSQTLEERSAAQVVTKVYAIGLDVIGQRTRFPVGAAPARVLYLGHDVHGSVRHLSDASGTLIGFRNFDAFGVPLATDGVEYRECRLGYAAQEFVPELGQYANRARILDQSRGRFWTMDPSLGDQGLPMSLHRYLYAHANPVTYTDPSGYAIANNPGGLDPQKYGYGAEAAISQDYDAEHPNDYVLHGKWIRLWPFYMAKPDIHNRTAQRYGEIKPFTVTGIIAGNAQMTERAIQYSLINALYETEYESDKEWTFGELGTAFGDNGEEFTYFNEGTGLIFYMSPWGNAAELGAFVAVMRAEIQALVRPLLRSTVAYVTRAIVAGGATRLAVDGARMNAHLGIALLLAVFGIF